MKVSKVMCSRRGLLGTPFHCVSPQSNKGPFREKLGNTILEYFTQGELNYEACCDWVFWRSKKTKQKIPVALWNRPVSKFRGIKMLLETLPTVSSQGAEGTLSLTCLCPAFPRLPHPAQACQPLPLSEAAAGWAPACHSPAQPGLGPVQLDPPVGPHPNQAPERCLGLLQLP